MKTFYGTLIKQKNHTNGIWYLDNDRLIFNKRSLWAVIFWGGWADYMTTGKQTLVIKTSDIKKIEKTKFRLNKNAIKLILENEVVELTITNHKKFLDAIKEKVK